MTIYYVYNAIREGEIGENPVEILDAYEDAFELGKFESDAEAIEAACEAQRKADRKAEDILKRITGSDALEYGPCYPDHVWAIEDPSDPDEEPRHVLP